MKHRNLTILLFLSCCIASAQSKTERIQAYVDSMYRQHPNTVGIMLNIESPERHLSWNYAVGYSDKKRQIGIDAQQPVLIASNTKTYIAASILRLVEQNKVQLNQPIDELISKKSKELLSKSGYLQNNISVRNLLSHRSGITDYANDAYFEFVNSHKNYAWTRDEQIAIAMKSAKPSILPNDTFMYADINYLLLTEIIENSTGKPFYQALQELLVFKQNNLKQTWFTKLQKVPAATKPLAHQYWKKYDWDSYDIDPSWDLYGGGGIVATTKDLSVFFQQLFSGKIIKDQKVLGEMYTDVSAKSNYCLGIRKVSIAGLKGYYHGGFWGTDAIYFPDLNTAISIFILERSERDVSSEICKKIVEILKENN